eukprot:6187883-Pleurochrysis_carterae.AAC.1
MKSSDCQPKRAGTWREFDQGLIRPSLLEAACRASLSVPDVARIAAQRGTAPLPSSAQTIDEMDRFSSSSESRRPALFRTEAESLSGTGNSCSWLSTRSAIQAAARLQCYATCPLSCRRPAVRGRRERLLSISLSLSCESLSAI